MKSIFITLSLILFVSCAKKEDADINKIVSDAYPNVSIESLKKIDENFHEIIINNQLYYATNDGKYLLVGGLFFCKRNYLARKIYCVLPRSMDKIVLN